MQAVQFRIARHTNQLNAMVQFYTEGLGLPLIGQFENHRGYNGAMIGLPGYTYHLEFTERLLPGALPPPHPDNLLVFYFDLPAEYLRAIHQLTIIGAKQVQPSNPYWAEKAQTFEDPDGNRIVLCNGVFKK